MTAMEKSSQLFSLIRMRGLELANRVVVSPMCQYSAEQGSATDWHMMHLGTLAGSGAGLLIIEATAVEAIGRITSTCLGLYSDNNEAALKRVIEACRRYGHAKLGIQLAHAGRKGSSDRPWDGGRHMAPDHTEGWQTWGPSALAYGPGYYAPRAYDKAGLEALKAVYVKAVERSLRVGFDMIELHAAHGYLMHQFLSPISNKRTDEYGGSLENRMRLPLETFAAVRAAWPESRPIGVRISATDWTEGGWDLDQSVVFCDALKRLGCDYIVVSSGGNVPDAKIPVGPAFQTPFATEIRKRVGIPAMAVGMISEPEQAETIVREGKADMIAIARAFLDDPHWAVHAAYRLGASALPLPTQYHRATLKTWPLARRHAEKMG